MESTLEMEERKLKKPRKKILKYGGTLNFMCYHPKCRQKKKTKQIKLACSAEINLLLSFLADDFFFFCIETKQCWG